MASENVRSNHKARKRKHSSQDGTMSTEIVADTNGLSSASPQLTHPLLVSPSCNNVMSRLLCVPLSFIFRRSMITPPSSKPLKVDTMRLQDDQMPPLLSKAEASLFLRLHPLACQLDGLISLSYEALYRSSVCRALSSALTHHNDNSIVSRWSSSMSRPIPSPLERALLPFLTVHGVQIPQRILLEYIPSETHRILRTELEPICKTLRDFSDQNWKYVELLNLQNNVVSTEPVASLAWEKSILAEIQEVLSRRIQKLVEQGLDSEEEEESMDDLCRRLMSGSEYLIENQELTDEIRYPTCTTALKELNYSVGKMIESDPVEPDHRDKNCVGSNSVGKSISKMQLGCDLVPKTIDGTRSTIETNVNAIQYNPSVENVGNPVVLSKVVKANEKTMELSYMESKKTFAVTHSVVNFDVSLHNALLMESYQDVESMTQSQACTIESQSYKVKLHDLKPRSLRDCDSDSASLESR